MSESSGQLDRNAIEELLRDYPITRVVTIVNLSSQSILELLEYGISRHDINIAFAKGVIAFDKSSSTHISPDEGNINPEKGGDYYIRYLSNKVKLTELGIYILETIEQNNVLLISRNDPSLIVPDQAMEVKSLPDNEYRAF